MNAVKYWRDDSFRLLYRSTIRYTFPFEVRSNIEVRDVRWLATSFNPLVLPRIPNTWALLKGYYAEI